MIGLFWKPYLASDPMHGTYLLMLIERTEPVCSRDPRRAGPGPEACLEYTWNQDQTGRA